MAFVFRGAVSALLLTVSFVSLGQCKEFAFFHENVLGTSLELRVNAYDQAAANTAESMALAEIDRLCSIYSHYDKQCEFSRFVAAQVGEHVSMSSELREILSLCDQWKSASGGSFEPATEQLAKLWRQAAASGIRPSHEAIAATLDELSQPHWNIDISTGHVTRTSSAPLSLNAIAKGVILDCVASSLLASDHVHGVMLSIGGDIRVAGKISAKIDIAHPKSDAIGGETLSSLEVAEGGIATSGNSERFFEIAGQRYSHIFDPRNGMPVSHTISATVIAKDASTADAVATICSVLSVRESLALVNSIEGVDCLLMTESGDIARSANWPQVEPQRGTATTLVSTQAETSTHEMSIEFEIAKAENSGRYRRPYVGVWIEDKDGFPVKTLSLFLMQNDPGPRWYRDLRRWYTDDQLRKLVDETDLIATVSKPTRNPGVYKVNWDGNDDAGKRLKPGKYTLLVESAREHGSYQLMKHEFEFGASFEKSLTPNKEISSVKIRYVAK